jgi:hypothetical protein
LAAPVFVAEHAWQVPEHALSQQKPSTQLPEAHTVVGVQASAGPSFAEQAPVLVLQ